MTSLFDTDVQRRREHTPWAVVSLLAFVRDVVWQKPEIEATPFEHEVTIHCRLRPDVASRLWWMIEWTGANGERLEARAQEFDLLMWRAAEAEMRTRARMELEKRMSSSATSGDAAGGQP